MGASSDRKITIDYDRQLQADGFDHFVRLRFEHSRGGESPSHKWVDVHSTIVEGVATNVDTAITAHDRKALRWICNVAAESETDDQAMELIGHIIKWAWGADIRNAVMSMYMEGVETEAEEVIVTAGFCAYLRGLGLLLAGV